MTGDVIWGGEEDRPVATCTVFFFFLSFFLSFCLSVFRFFTSCFSLLGGLSTGISTASHSRAGSTHS